MAWLLKTGIGIGLGNCEDTGIAIVIRFSTRTGIRLDSMVYCDN
jgi:hypothetical protein